MGKTFRKKTKHEIEKEILDKDFIKKSARFSTKVKDSKKKYRRKNWDDDFNKWYYEEYDEDDIIDDS